MEPASGRQSLNALEFTKHRSLGGSFQPHHFPHDSVRCLGIGGNPQIQNLSLIRTQNKANMPSMSLPRASRCTGQGGNLKGVRTEPAFLLPTSYLRPPQDPSGANSKNHAHKLHAATGRDSNA